MSGANDRERLIAMDNSLRQRAKPPGRIWDLLASIHAAPGLREWVTLESVPLCPYLAKANTDATTQIRVAALLTRKISAGEGVLPPPWACVVWAWPSKRLLAMVDISGLIPAAAIGLDCVATEEVVNRMEQALAGGQALSLPPEPVARLYELVFRELPLLKPDAGAIVPASAPDAALVADAPSVRQPFPTPSSSTRQPATIRPAPLGSSELAGFLPRAREMIAASGIDPLVGEWRKIYARLHEAVFSVACVGEFSRGKSTLVNRLLDMDLLPVGELPTTAVLTRVMFGSEPRMWRIRPDRKREQLPLAPESWADLTADDDGNDPQGVVQIEVPHPWLQQSRVELIDTPGAGDLTGTRAAITAEAIANCDATLVLVNATMAISLTERAFVEEHVFLARIPRVAVVLSRLDQVAQPERQSVVRHVQDQLRTWAPQAALWCANDATVVSATEALTAIGPAAIREKITEWATDESRGVFRRRQLAAQLQDLLTVLLCTLESQKALATSTEADREKARKELARNLDKSRLDWEEIRLDLDQRSLDLEAWLEQTVLDAQRAVTDSLSLELSRVPNPMDWWKDELPFRLNNEVGRLSRGLTQNIQAKIGQDMAWLSGEVGKRFAWRIPSQRYQNEEQLGPVTVTPAADGLADSKRLQYVTRLGGPALMALGFVLPPLRLVGPLLGVAGTLVGEVVTHKRTAEQRNELVQALGENVETAMRQAIREMRTRIRGFFCQVLDEARRQEGVWLAAQQQAAAKSDQADGSYVTQLDQALQRIADLCHDISKALART